MLVLKLGMLLVIRAANTLVQRVPLRKMRLQYTIRMIFVVNYLTRKGRKRVFFLRPREYLAKRLKEKLPNSCWPLNGDDTQKE